MKCYGILCYSKKIGTFYPRYLVTLGNEDIKLEDIQQKAYPQAIRVITADTRKKCSKLMAPLTINRDPPQKGLFEE